MGAIDWWLFNEFSYGRTVSTWLFTRKKVNKLLGGIKKRKGKLHRQMKFSLHQSKKGDTLAQNSCESLLPQSYTLHPERVNGDLEGYWN
eukprot:1144581-Pelagomonas_calceolata.AAC.8